MSIITNNVFIFCLIFFASCTPNILNLPATSGSQTSTGSNTISKSRSGSRSTSGDQVTTDNPVRGDTTTSCVQDEDCVLVSEGCCPCNSGGIYIAIHRSQKDSYENKLREKCSFRMMCPAWYRCGEWEDKARCINAECSAIKKIRN